MPSSALSPLHDLEFPRFYRFESVSVSRVSLPVSAWQVSPQPCALCHSGGLRVHATHGVCIYAFGSQSCAARLDWLRCARLTAAKLAAHGTSGVRRACDRSQPRSRSPRRRSRRLRGVSRRDASSVEYNLLASRRAPPRIRRTASPRVAQLGARPLAALPQLPIGALLSLHPARLRLWLCRLAPDADEVKLPCLIARTTI